jgi:hypothetical protein
MSGLEDKVYKVISPEEARTLLELGVRGIWTSTKVHPKWREITGAWYCPVVCRVPGDMWRVECE